MSFTLDNDVLLCIRIGSRRLFMVTGQKCAYPKCKLRSDTASGVMYYDRFLCDKHWDTISGLRVALAHKKLNILGWEAELQKLNHKDLKKQRIPVSEKRAAQATKRQ